MPATKDRVVEHSPDPPSRGIPAALWSLVTPPAFEAREPAVSGVRYRDRAGRGIAPLADVYLPDGPGPHPSVVVVHGGGFVIGTRSMKPVRFIATRLAEAGFAVGCPDYRMIFRGGRIREALDDVREMVSWWRGRAAEYSLDSDRISIAGFSAGGALSLMHAAAHDGIDRVVGIYGVYDFTHLSGRLAGLMRRLLFRSADPEVWREHSPLITCRTPRPVLLVHGSGDVMAPIGQAERLAAMRREAGLPVDLRVYPGQPHAFFNDATLDHTREAVGAIIGFLGATDPG